MTQVSPTPRTGLIDELRNGWKRMGETGHQLYARDLFERAAEALTSKDEEIERLRLAICGGEDAPGYAASLPLESILEVAAENIRSWRDASDRALSLEAQVEGLKRALGKWSCKGCDGRGTNYYEGQDHVCRICDRSGLNPIARAALASLPQGKDQGASTETERRDGALLVPSQTPLSDALARRAYVTSGPHLSGHRVCIGFESSDDAFAFHSAVAKSVAAPPQTPVSGDEN